MQFALGNKHQKHFFVMANKLILIGIDKYLFHDPLNNCAKDARDLKDILLEKYDFEEWNVSELYNQNATSKAIQDLLMKTVDTLSASDNLVIFFSGHGHYESTRERGYWIPTEGTHTYTSWIANDSLIAILTPAKSKHIVLISDSCFSNTLFLVNPIKGLREYSKYNSRWALTSAFTAAYDSSKGQNGPFAKAIIEFLQEKESAFRFGELVESVKKKFEVDQFQSPQGSPIACKGHSGGEMTFDIRAPFDKRSLKGYKDFEKVLKLYKRTSEFKELGVYEDKQEKIGYQLFQEVDSVVRKLTYYLYLYEGISLSKTAAKLREKHQQIFTGKFLIVFLPSQKTGEVDASKLSQVMQKFKPVNAFYIEQFIRDQCTPKFATDSDTFLSISNFIVPSLANEDGDVEEKIQKWFDKDRNPILIVKGTGGIGKTTFVQFFADQWSKKTRDSHVVFIDSIQIRDVFMRRNMNFEAVTIYNFYEAYCDISGITANKLSEELFRLNVDAGNILLIIDGLDEVISKVPNFKVETFLNSINESSMELGGGKAIITCRTYFWDHNQTGLIDLAAIELEPFDVAQARSFFELSLPSNAQVKKAMKLADQFKYPGADSDNIYHPYVLDVIRSIVTSNDAVDVDLSGFSSAILQNAVKNDYIIFRICDRERKRIGQISVDEQVQFFMFLAVEKRGVINNEALKSAVEQAIGRRIDRTNVTGLLAHPFLKSNDTVITFRYDFLTDVFRAIHSSQYFVVKDTVARMNENVINLIEENCWYGSGVSLDIVSRLNSWDELNLLVFSEHIDRIVNSELPQIRVRKILANLFSLCLSLNHRFIGNNVEGNTTIMKTLFQKQVNEITSLCIVHLNFEPSIKFDFSGLTISKAYIEDYHAFWDCKFDSKTVFIDCNLLSIRERKAHQVLSAKNFIDCTYDRSVEDTLRRFREHTINNVEKAKTFLHDFLHLFFSSGKLGRQWEYKIIQPRFPAIAQNIFHYNDVIKMLKSDGVLVLTKEKEGTKMAIADQHREDVVRFIKDGTISPIISQLTVKLSKMT
ncbi:MAG: caspase family protein [Chryseolinea sp.]